MIKYFK